MSDIYNKNAREKALLEEAYGNVYTEGGKIRRLFTGIKDLFGKDKCLRLVERALEL